MYERQSAGSMEVGSYAHRPIFHRPDDIPSNDEAALSPTELPFTDEDFDDQLEDALEIMGDILETAEIRYAINGLLSLTPDAMPVLGETVEVRNLWSAAAVWIKEGPGIAQLDRGVDDLRLPAPVRRRTAPTSRRFYPHERTEHHIEARCAEHFNKTYGIVHPREQWASERGMRRSAVLRRARRRSARCSSTPAAGNVRSGTSRTRRCATSSPASASRVRTSGTHGGGRRSRTPSTSRCGRGVGMVDLTAFCEFDIDRIRARSPACSTSSSTSST